LKEYIIQKKEYVAIEMDFNKMTISSGNLKEEQQSDLIFHWNQPNRSLYSTLEPDTGLRLLVEAALSSPTIESKTRLSISPTPKRAIQPRKLKQHQCNICLQLVTTKYYLKIHAMKHTGEKPHKCSACGKCFTTKYCLKNTHDETYW
jgi:hypothetical protein